MYYGYRRRSIFASPGMVILYIVIAILLLVYFGGVFFFNSHYLPNTTIGNVPCGFRTAEYVADENAAQAQRYSLLVNDRKDSLYVIEAKKFDYQYVYTGEEDKILEEQNPFTWPAALFKDTSYTLGYSVSYDKAKLQAEVDNLALFQEDYINKPVDAYISLGKDGYTIVPEDMGNSPIAEQISKEIFACVDTGKTSLTLSNDCYIPPKVFSSSEVILKAAGTIDTYLKGIITYTIWDGQEVFGRENIMAAIRLDSEFNVTLDTKVFDKFAQYLATKYNTYSDAREFKTTKGGTVKIGGGDYGWVISKNKEAAEILANITAGKPVTREPKWSQTAVQAGPYDIGDTYIEVDYTNQHMWFYKEGELILESDFVSGNMSNGNGSPDGIFKVNYKERNARLVGEDYDTTVDYFIQFAHNVGFHDLDNRYKWGGTIYKTQGSHGCLNMPYEVVKTMHSVVPIGTPVVAFYREEVELLSESAKISNAYSYVEPPKEDETKPQ